MILTLKNASFGYDGNIVIHDICFTINKGDFLCIVGENGSGKSTLIKGILRLIKPMKGDLLYGKNITQKDIGYLSQENIDKKDFPAGVFEIVLSGNLAKMGLRPFYSAKDKRLAEEYLSLLGISDIKNSCFRELSGGQQRRVLLARSLCAAQKILILDEPFAGLDPLITSELYQLLRKINNEIGITIIMVSHDLDAAEYATHALHLKRKQLFYGTMDEYKLSETGRNFFINLRGDDDMDN
jgi:zinc transport system ATP-binding protein